jgi:hypothetical protein
VVGSRGDKWLLIDNLVTVSSHIYIPPGSLNLPTILANAHGTSHKGTKKTLHRLHVNFHILSTCVVVHDSVPTCMISQCNKSEHLHPVRLLQPLEVSSSIWSDVAMDFIEGFPHVNGKSVILTVVDRFSMYAHFVPLGQPYITPIVSHAIFDDIVRLNCDSVFGWHFWRDPSILTGVKLHLSSMFHSQLMDNQRPPTKLSQCIFTAPSKTSRTISCSGFPRQSSTTIQCSML